MDIVRFEESWPRVGGRPGRVWASGGAAIGEGSRSGNGSERDGSVAVRLFLVFGLALTLKFAEVVESSSGRKRARRQKW
jgi:hypothetical protein